MLIRFTTKSNIKSTIYSLQLRSETGSEGVRLDDSQETRFILVFSFGLGNIFKTFPLNGERKQNLRSLRFFDLVCTHIIAFHKPFSTFTFTLDGNEKDTTVEVRLKYIETICSRYFPKLCAKLIVKIKIKVKKKKKSRKIKIISKRKNT